MSLAGAAAALDAGDHATALREILAAWFLCKHERIVAVIEVVSRRAARGRDVPDGTTLAEKQAAWLALEAKRDPADLEHLLSTLGALTRLELLEVRLEALARRPPDPRIATALHAWIPNPPVKALAASVLAVVQDIGDPRSRAVLEQVSVSGKGAAARTLRSLIMATRSALRWQPAILSPGDEANLATIECALAAGQRDLAALFAAVYANSDDDGPRSVLADALQEAGDPRGEFIALQLARSRGGKGSKGREAVLRQQYEAAWLGPILPALVKDTIVFERGFLARCTVRGREDATALCAHVEWSTVVEVTLDHWAPIEPLLAAMPVLRVLSGIARGDQVPSHARLEELDVRSDVDALCSRALPALHWIRIGSCPELPRMMAMLRSPLGLQLRKLSVTVSDGEAWNAWFSTRRFEWGVVAQLDTPWRLYFEGDRISCSYFNLGPPVAEPEIMAGLTRTLASVVERPTYHLRIGKKLPSTEGLESLLKSFASYTLAE